MNRNKALKIVDRLYANWEIANAGQDEWTKTRTHTHVTNAIALLNQIGMKDPGNVRWFWMWTLYKDMLIV